MAVPPPPKPWTPPPGIPMQASHPNALKNLLDQIEGEKPPEPDGSIQVRDGRS